MVQYSGYAFKTYSRLSMIISKIILKAKEKREISNLISDTVCMRGRVWRVRERKLKRRDIFWFLRI